jgi:hypothetical protein
MRLDYTGTKIVQIFIVTNSVILDHAVLLRAKKWDIKFLSVLKNSMWFKLYCHFLDNIPPDSLQNLFYTPIFLFQMTSFFDKGRF